MLKINNTKKNIKNVVNNILFGEVDEATTYKYRKIKIKWFLYHSFLAILSIVSIVLIICDANSYINIYSSLYFSIDLLILLIFTVDFLVGAIRCTSKKNYFRNNFLILISILPIFFLGFRNNIFSEIFLVFQLLSIIRVFKVIKFLAIVLIFKKREFALSRILRTNGFIYLLYVSFTIILSCSIALSFFEQISLWDSLWLSFVTCATVGFGDIIPATVAGRIICIVLMLVGVGLIGTLTSTLTTYFSKRPNLQKESLKLESVVLAKQANELSKEQIESLTGFAKMMKNGDLNITVNNMKDVNNNE